MTSYDRTTTPVVQVATAPPRLLTIAEAAAWTGTCDKTIRRRIAEGALPYLRIGPKAIRLLEADVIQAFRHAG